MIKTSSFKAGIKQKLLAESESIQVFTNSSVDIFLLSQLVQIFSVLLLQLLIALESWCHDTHLSYRCHQIVILIVYIVLVFA